MLLRFAGCIALIFFALQPLVGGDKDHLQRGEAKLKYDFEIKYDRAVRRLLARGWNQDVVLRTVALNPFDPENVLGIVRSGEQYRAFVLKPSMQIWEATGLGDPEPHPKNRIANVRPIYHSRLIGDSLAVRVAMMWRKVLNDRRNYSKDANVYTDTSQTIFYIAFAPNEHVTANMMGWGPKTKNLILVSQGLMDYAAGKKSEAELLLLVEEAERKLGI
jgi:hypothetical protein